MWKNDIKCKYMFLFPLSNSARKGLPVERVVLYRKQGPKEPLFKQQYWIEIIDSIHIEVWTIVLSLADNISDTLSSKKLYLDSNFTVVYSIKNIDNKQTYRYNSTYEHAYQNDNFVK